MISTMYLNIHAVLFEFSQNVSEFEDAITDHHS